MRRAAFFLWIIINSGASQSPTPGPAEGSASASSYKLEWRRHFYLQCGTIPAGSADEDGELWLITRGRLITWGTITRIDSEGRLIGTFDPRFPLKPIEWVDYLSPAASGRSIGLLASLVSGGQQQIFEGAFFVPVGRDALGAPRRIAGRGPQFPTLVGAGSGQFIAAGDQEPLTLIKLDSAGSVLWRRSFSSKLVLPTVAVGADRKILVVSQAGGYLQLHLLNQSGRLLASRRIPAAQGTVVADAGGGWSILTSKDYNDNENRVYLTALDPMIRRLSQVETPLRARGGRTYQLIATPRGHLIIGEGSSVERCTIAELDLSGRLLWQQAIRGPFTPLLAPFPSGFYIVRNVWKGKGIDIEKYLY
jgi:hypothetical protein